MPVPSLNPAESGFLAGMQKFSDLTMDAANFEGAFYEETGKFAAYVQRFLDEDLGDVPKKLKKEYDSARGEYEKVLAKLGSLRDNKKLPIAKLYEAEKDKTRALKAYQVATRALEDHCDDLDDLLNVLVVSALVDWAVALKNMLGLAYGQLDDVKEYLQALRRWCQDEERVCAENKAARDAQRADDRQAETAAAFQQFAATFTLDLIHLASSIGQDSTSLILSFCCLFHAAQVPLPDGLEKFPGATLDPTAKAPIDIAAFVRENIEVLGLKLVNEEGQPPLFYSLAENLAALEKPA